MKLIVGLGNPGPDYANHKHNIGQWVLDVLTKELKLKWENDSLAVVSWTTIEKEDCWFAKPKIFMNESGKAVKVLLKEKRLSPNDLIVIHDDMDIALGKLRWGFGSGFGGHNGAKSIIDLLGTKDFYRVRLGIGRPPAHKDPVEYVLEPFTRTDLELAEGLVEKAAHSIKDFMKHPLEWVQSHYH